MRAGALRLLDQMPEVKVAPGTLDGKQVLNLTVGMPAMPGESPQTITIDAATGVPLKLSNGSDGSTTFVVTRISLADVKKGSF
ncbi:hypothetical protein [Actinoplanes sp. NPDC048796]|uniref:hypothetical protein n=1 Tax=Actinoplanes sp. NPDC048796 TaxID=3155640 RepID=UPI0033F7C26E